MELLDCKKQIKDLVFMMANGIGVATTVEFLNLLIVLLTKNEAD